MESKLNRNHHGSNENADLKLEDVDSFIKHMERLLKELWGKINQLPKVDNSGYSECPFAEDLYAYKEEAAAKVEEESKKLEQFLELVKEEIVRCKHNIEQLRLDRNSLNLEEAKKRYTAAKKSQQSQLNKAVHQQKLLIELIKRSEELLKLAREKKWPLGKPRSRDSFNPAEVLQAAIDGKFSALREPTHIRSRAVRPSFASEVSDLVSLGPLEGPS